MFSYFDAQCGICTLVLHVRVLTYLQMIDVFFTLFTGQIWHYI